MLSVRCLSVLFVCLSVTFVHCGQMLGRIKTKLGMQVGQRGTSPQFSAHICCGQMAAWIKMSIGMELGLSPGDFVLNGDPASLPKRGGGSKGAPNFRPMFIAAKQLDG